MGGPGSGPARRYVGVVEESCPIDAHECAREGRLSAYRECLRATSTRSPIGPPRWWWLCPACDRRCRFVYLTGSGVCCRLCAHLTYRSRRLHRLWLYEQARPMERLEWLLRR
jgi:hypothetical protein